MKSSINSARYQKTVLITPGHDFNQSCREVPPTRSSRLAACTGATEARAGTHDDTEILPLALRNDNGLRLTRLHLRFYFPEACPGGAVTNSEGIPVM